MDEIYFTLFWVLSIPILFWILGASPKSTPQTVKQSHCIPTNSILRKILPLKDKENAPVVYYWVIPLYISICVFLLILLFIGFAFVCKWEILDFVSSNICPTFIRVYISIVMIYTIVVLTYVRVKDEKDPKSKESLKDLELVSKILKDREKQEKVDKDNDN